MMSIREKLETDEKIIFEDKANLNPFINSCIAFAITICIPLYTTINDFWGQENTTIIKFIGLFISSIFYFFNNHPVIFLISMLCLLSVFMTIIDYFIAEFIVTDKRIMTKGPLSLYKLKEILLEDVEFVDIIRGPLNSIKLITIYKNRSTSGNTPYIYFNSCNPEKLQEKLVLYIKATKNNTLNQDLARKSNTYDSIKALVCVYESAINKPKKLNNGVDIPQEIYGWNWGAFFLNGLWGLFNKSYMALWAFLPWVGPLWYFVCGFKGNEWAWKNRKWKSIEHFQAVQKKWAFYGSIVWGIFWGLFILFVTAGILVDFIPNNISKIKDIRNVENVVYYEKCNVATYKAFSILLPKQMNRSEAVYQLSTLENLADTLEKATKDKLVYLDVRNPNEVYAQMENIRFRVGDLKSDEVFNKIEKAAFVIPEAMKIKDKIDYIDLNGNNISIKLIKEGQSHNSYTIKQICKED